MTDICFGYACINNSLPSRFRTMQRKQYLELAAKDETLAMEKAKSITIFNLKEALRILRWNRENKVPFYRFSSDLVPLATIAELRRSRTWYDDPEIRQNCAAIHHHVETYGPRTSLHPGQYCVLNTPNPDVLTTSLFDLQHHVTLAKMLGATALIVHIGGGYGNKTKAMERFIEVAHGLDETTRSLLCIENDDRTYTLEETCFVGEKAGLPVVFDVHHHRCNPCDAPAKHLACALNTWGDRRPKVHISTGVTGPTDRRHADYIAPEDFEVLAQMLADAGSSVADVDIMVEAKEKDKALLQLREQIAQSL
ncbi:UV DNA damage repair endonuclease UvsE [Heliophilum fasciatum]|uniref:UV-damage endonuclease n=1 Tax=Heliophilum fasciatum TaxID=35700 RepID=A0A4R2RM31_9FIRM|nr:UV DNA damage repair endonuclease UvsE [Heliophilum fasciatum]MCW2278392.1 UV DNA damage endonuclease [Heliophilum fasciatum]TCP63709.1 UV-damage endonuclease [Heliophilum fasciatum]